LSNCYHHDIKRIFLLPNQQELITLVKIKQEQPIDLWMHHDSFHLNALIRDHQLHSLTQGESLQPHDFLIILLESLEHITYIEDILTKSQSVPATTSNS
ncbi:MAG: hypothetical protein P8N43_13600, partial [Alphaproteobacteria bacterium]|nr:hypothetical protein [Alphaproteobacteria bacterium]